MGEIVLRVLGDGANNGGLQGKFEARIKPEIPIMSSHTLKRNNVTSERQHIVDYFSEFPKKRGISRTSSFTQST